MVFFYFFYKASREINVRLKCEAEKKEHLNGRGDAFPLE